MIEFEAVSKRYGDTLVIDRLTLRIERGELFVLVGASGSGKSTLLRMINRLIEPDAGCVRVDGHDVRDRPAEALRREIGYAIQSTGLFPHWTVAQNIATVPQLLGWSATRIRARVAEMLMMLQLDPALADRYPAHLSGGQLLRVGVARALAGDPPIVLMDEPFGALDPLTREALQVNLREIQRSTGKTVVFVTHDMDEAVRLGDRMALVADGRIRQAGSALELLQQPVDEEVRGFFGGSEQALRVLGLRQVREAMQPADAAGAPPIGPGASLQQALGLMLANNVETLSVIGEDGRMLGRLDLSDLIKPPA